MNEIMQWLAGAAIALCAFLVYIWVKSRNSRKGD